MTDTREKIIIEIQSLIDSKFLDNTDLEVIADYYIKREAKAKARGRMEAGHEICSGLTDYDCADKDCNKCICKKVIDAAQQTAEKENV